MSVRIDTVDWQRSAPQLHAVREEVFVREQSIPAELEWDGQDQTAAHFLATDGSAAVGTARLLGSGQIGRMAVLKRWRRRGVGARLLAAAVEQARQLGHARVFLHAQVDAAGFYARGGFRSTGAVFIEAGIVHVAMERDLSSYPVPAPPGGLAVASGAAPTGGAMRATPVLLPQASASGTRRITDEATMRLLLLQIAQLARRQICIYSQQLDPPLYNTADMETTLSELARRHPNTRVRILIHDSTRMVQIGHRLIRLGRRLSSSIQFRQVVGDQRLAEYSYLLADDRAIVFQPRFNDYIGFAQANDAVLVRQKVIEFDDVWNRSVEDPDLRQLRL